MGRKGATENVTSDEMMLREFRIDNLGCFNQNYSEKCFEYVINRL